MMAYLMEVRMISLFLEVQVMMVMQMMSGQTKVQGKCCVVSFHVYLFGGYILILSGFGNFYMALTI